MVSGSVQQYRVTRIEMASERMAMWVEDGAMVAGTDQGSQLKKR